MVRLKDIAELSNVSAAAVSRILNEDPTFSVKQETRDLVKKIAKENNYRTKAQKAGQTQKEISKVSIISSMSAESDADNPYYLELRKKIEQVLKGRNYEITYEHINVLNPDKILDSDFFIVLGQIHRKELKPITDKTSNIVFVGSAPGPVDYDSIGPNIEQGMLDIFAYINTLKVDSLGFIGADVVEYNSFNYTETVFNVRYEYFLLLAEKYGLLNKDNIYIGRYSTEQGYELMQEAIESRELADLYIVANDIMSMGACKALSEHGLKIPEDVAIISFDDTDYARYSIDSLTSLNLNVSWMADSVQTIIDSRLAGRDYPIKIAIPTELVIRDSTEKK